MFDIEPIEHNYLHDKSHAEPEEEHTFFFAWKHEIEPHQKSSGKRKRNDRSLPKTDEDQAMGQKRLPQAG
jgi:hypothetical protein